MKPCAGNLSIIKALLWFQIGGAFVYVLKHEVHCPCPRLSEMLMLLSKTACGETNSSAC